MANELALLHGIHLPVPIDFWPPALGWWLMLILIILSAVIGYWYGRRTCQKEALKLLAEYQQHYQIHKNPVLISQQINQLLKRVALVYFPRAEVARLNGQEWLNFLNQHGKKLDFNTVAYHLSELPYQAVEDALNVDITLLLVQTKAWIRQRGRLCLG